MILTPCSDSLPIECFQRVTARLANSLPQVVIRYAYTDEDTVSLIRIAIEEAACTSEAWEKVSSAFAGRATSASHFPFPLSH